MLEPAQLLQAEQVPVKLLKVTMEPPKRALTEEVCRRVRGFHRFEFVLKGCTAPVTEDPSQLDSGGPHSLVFNPETGKYVHRRELEGGSLTD